MRILHIRFKNLNSLFGEWQIDLTQPAFTVDGIFAITGPTGAGKTTILDALCLALYGSTPRLGKLSKSSNDLMSRQAVECFAEVSFSTQAGTYRAHWSQHRARRKADGELQTPKHEIVDASNGQPLATALREVAEKVEALTGLDFERFTRSMLLAQGSFAAFLNAGTDERAPILEQITGTTIYSDISIKVHERRSTEQKKLDSLKERLKGLRSLSAAEEQLYREQLKQYQTQAQQLDQQLHHTQQAIQWRQTLQQYRADLAQLHTQQALLTERQTQFHAKAQRLQQANQALELAADYTHLTHTRHQTQRLQQQLGKNAQDQQQYQHQLTALTDTVKQAEAALQQQQQAHANLRLSLKQVRELDNQREQIQLRLQALQLPYQKAKQQHQTAQHQQNDLAARHQCLQQQWAEVTEYCQTQAADQMLVEQLAGLQQRFKQLHQLSQQQQQKQQACQHTEQALAQQQYSLHQQQEETQHALTAWQDAQQHYQQAKHTLQSLLQQENTTVWRERLDQAKDQAQHLTLLLQHLQQLDSLQQHRSALEQEQTTLQQQQTEQAHALIVATARVQTAEARQHQLETELALAQVLQSLEQHRAQLQDGQACPLCGALEHPYTLGQLPHLNTSEQALQQAKQTYTQAQEQLIHLKTQQAANQQALQQTAATRQQCLIQLEQQHNTVQQALKHDTLKALGLTSLAETAITTQLQTIQQSLADTQQTITQRQAHLQQIEQQEQTLNRLHQTLQDTQQQYQHTERRLLEAQHITHQLQQQHQQLSEEQALSDQHRLAEWQHIQTSLAPYLTTPVKLDQLSDIEQSLQQRRQQWLEQQTLQQKLQAENSALTEQQHATQQQVQHYHEQLEHYRAQQSALAQEDAALQQQRWDLFGEQSCDEQEQQSLQLLEAFQAELIQQQQKHHQTRFHLDQLQQEQFALEPATASQTQALQETTQQFQARLAQFNFVDENAYLAARLPDSERHALLQQAQALATEQTELKAQLTQKTYQIDLEQTRQLSTDTLEHLQHAYTVLKQQQTDTLQAIGKTQRALEEHQAYQVEQAAQLQQIRLQEQECERWSLLHDLIGSADGKKYRNFAQGLTFEIMIQHANQQLQRMSDRYLLIRHTSQPLELNVVDTYQAGEIRTTRNLSGGESFIVSLALALGLSQMASQTVRVDSLFLDEGFGTLDQEALDIALETLSTLQQEGKLIGVISHVQAMQERISTQIRVQPQTGGRSVLIGPGCQGL